MNNSDQITPEIGSIWCDKSGAIYGVVDRKLIPFSEENPDICHAVIFYEGLETTIKSSYPLSYWHERFQEGE